MYLRADGSWSEPTNTVYDNATQTVAGLMSKDDKTKLDGVAVGANKYIHPSYSAQSNKLYKVTVDSQGHVSATSEVTKADIVALGVPSVDTVYTLPVANTSVLGGVKANSNVSIASDGTMVVNNATNAVNATNAAKAVSDANGKAIVDTYATKDEVSTLTSNASEAYELASTANEKADACISKSGDRGTLAGYNTPTTTSLMALITDSSDDDIVANSAISISVMQGQMNASWTKTVAIRNAGTTISIGSNWYWANGATPKVTANSLLVLKWTGYFGVANLISEV